MRMMGKRGTILILLLLAAAILSQSLITPSASLEYPAIYIDPPSTNNTGLTPGNSYTISIKTDYTGSDIWGWSFSLTYNPLVLNGTGVVNGNLTTNATHPGFAAFNTTGFDNYAGELGVTEGYFATDPFATPPTNVTSGPGTLANVTFKVVGYGDSDIKLGDETKLIGYSGGFYDIIYAKVMPGNIGHGYFRNVADVPTHDIAVISVVPNETKVLAPASVSINVTVKNEGNASERFAVEVYYDSIHSDYFIGSVMVDNLTTGDQNWTLFTWDTTRVEQGNHTIIAKAGPVALESITANNQNEEAWVNVYSPCITVLPESKINPDLTPGKNYTVAIYTDYDSTKVVDKNNTYGYNLTLTYNPNVLQGIDVTNGGNIPLTAEWKGNGTTTTFKVDETTTPIVSDSETVQGWEVINATLTKVELGGYTINYTSGEITFDTAPPWDVIVKVEYEYEMSLMPSATFTKGSFVDGQLTLTSASGANVSGPGVLATVTFNITAIGESDITLGNETVLIGHGSYKNITMRHRLKKGHFTNQGDAMMVKVDVDQPGIEVYPTGLWTFNITVIVQNIWGAPNFNVTVYYTVGPTDYTLGTKPVVGLTAPGKQTVKFTANMSGAPPGEHEISAKVVVLTGDHNDLNDYDSSGDVVKASLLSDIDGDCYVGPIDANEFLAGYGQNTGHPWYKAKADMDPAEDPDGYIGSDDMSWVGIQFGKRC